MYRQLPYGTARRTPQQKRPELGLTLEFGLDVGHVARVRFSFFLNFNLNLKIPYR